MGSVEVPFKCTGVAAVLLKREGADYKFLLLRRNSTILRNVWCYIGGSIEDGEAAWQAAFREIEEETGITDVSLYTSNLFDQIYSPEYNYIYVAPVFVGYVAEGETVELNEEHYDYNWLSFHEAVETVSLPGNDHVLESVKKHFVDRSPLQDLRVNKREEP
ncbi:NUDIX domain-containing protein [Halobacillus locisalis]|uniref:NUDIX domain-containing protein n=1 Tax=Halobacillus locisalis TaxID=220753 RepID=A0A838CXH1_9BACI|nr:NUDIX domain-containing protein [Halobacillus locisalis]MBA2176306.1 NUDIX domain-containing protein [Halobacillus locisalis]